MEEGKTAFMKIPVYVWTWPQSMFLVNTQDIPFPVAQMVEHGASNAKIMGLIPRESKSWSNVKL